MPELPDAAVYIEHLERRLVGRTLERVRLISTFVLRSVEPPIARAQGRKVGGARRLGKRVVIELEGKLFLVLHLMDRRTPALARENREPARTDHARRFRVR